MNFRKTPIDKRGTYAYPVLGDKPIVLRQGEDGVTDELIKELHSLDDAEVRNNLKNAGPQMTDSERIERREWEENHPGEKYPYRWRNISLDYLAGDDGDNDSLDKSHYISETATYMEVEFETEKEMTYRVLWFLTDIQKEVFYLIKMEGYTETEVARILGTSIANICKHMKKALERIEVEKPNIANNY